MFKQNNVVSAHTVERADSLWPGSSGVFPQQPAGGQSTAEKVWWALRWTPDGTAPPQSNSGLEQQGERWLSADLATFTVVMNGERAPQGSARRDHKRHALFIATHINNAFKRSQSNFSTHPPIRLSPSSLLPHPGRQTGDRFSQSRPSSQGSPEISKLSISCKNPSRYLFVIKYLDPFTER